MTDCPFCLHTGCLKDSPLYETDTLFVLGHLTKARQHALMIVPKRHITSPFEMSDVEFAALPGALLFAKQRLSALKPDGYTVGWNVDDAGGQTVAHVHLHVICRFAEEPAAGHGLNGLLRMANSPAPQA